MLATTSDHVVAVLPGQVICCAEPTILTTVLGSCVAVCLWDRRSMVGGINHFVLPSHSDGRASSRYGDVAMDALEVGMLRFGCRVVDLQAKLFGGAAVLFGRGGKSVGDSNVEVALAWLHGRRIPIAARHVGGTLGRHIRFQTETGDVFVRTL